MMRGNRRLPWAAALAVMLFAGLAPPAAHAQDLSKQVRLRVKEQELATIMNTIAVLTGSNILVDPQEAKRKVTVSLRQVSARKAIDLIAKLNKLEVRYPENDEKIVVIARPETLERSFDQGRTKTFRLRYANATKMAGILQKTLSKAGSISIEVDERTNSLIVSGTESLIKSVDELQSKLDTPVPQVLIDSKIVQVSTDNLRDIGFNWAWGTGFGVDSPNVPMGFDGAGGSGQLFTFTERQRIDPNSQFLQGGNQTPGAAVLQFGDFYRGNTFFDAIFTALERSSITRNLASPRVLAVNGAKAELQIGEEIIFSGGPSQGPESKDVGILLAVEPRINRDGFITMDVTVEQSSATFRDSDFPTISKINSKTSVQVRDGEEVLVGGLVTEDEDQVNTKIPFLGDIPVLKNLFTRRTRTPRTRELVILLTPRVIKQNLPGLGEATASAGGGGDGLGDDLSLGGGGGDDLGGGLGGGDGLGDDLGGGGGGDDGLGGFDDDDLGFDDDDFGSLD